VEHWNIYFQKTISVGISR